MHTSALKNAEYFFQTYVQHMPKEGIKLVEIGSQDLGGSVRDVCPKYIDYKGVDFVEGKSVDVVLEDPYTLPFEKESFDITISSSCLEHSEFFWLSFLEMLRVTKEDGLIYLNVPSNSAYHRHPVDCWRFYPDSGAALVNWGLRNGYKCELLESYTSNQGEGTWNDFVAVIAKNKNKSIKFTDRIVSNRNDFSNGITNLSSDILRFKEYTEDQRKFKKYKFKGFGFFIKRLIRRLIPRRIKEIIKRLFFNK
jgi:SAM-dependent methyltransferase